MLLDIKSKLRVIEATPKTDVDYNWCTEQEFNRFIQHERSRAERTGSSVSIATFNLSRFSKGKPKLDKINFTILLSAMIQAVNECVSRIDIKCLFEPARIGILLLDSPITTTKITIDKILNHVFIKLSKNNLEHTIENIKYIHVSSYPIDQFNEYYHLEAKPFICKTTIRKKPNKISVLKKIAQMNINWKRINLKNISESSKITSFYQQTTGKSNFLYKYLKRLADIAGSILFILISSPLMAVIAVLIKATSKGPVLYSQKRIGYFGNEFPFLKFRTMRVDCDHRIHQDYVTKLIKGETGDCNNGDDENPIFKLKDDPRVTSVGKFLRPFSLDELPQFFNVLRGDMSLVGPRPPLPYEVCEYDKWHYRRIFDIKPGITGLWQVSNRNRLTFDEMVRLDIQYTENWSFWLDLKILLSTFKAVLGSEGY